jgi:type I restriction enzyme M protein
MEPLLARLGCAVSDLPDFGYYSTGKPNEYLIYESRSDLRDSESVPLAEAIHNYFQIEVQPHVAEAWIDMDSVKVGYEISFNKHFYKHKPLRSLEKIATDIINLERQSEGLMAEILGVSVEALSGSNDA